MKKFLKFFIIALILIGLAIWSPWNSLKFSWKDLFGLNNNANQSGLTVNAISGNMEVYVDNELKGEVNPASSPFEVEDLKAGEHDILIVRKGSEDNSYYKFSRKLKFEKGINIVLSYELGPTQDFSAGYLFYAVSNGNFVKETTLSVISNPDTAKVSLDGNAIGNSPLQNISITTDKKHKLRIESDGYEPLEFEILPDSQADRDKLKGFNLVVETNLLKLPVNLVEELSE